MTAAAPAHFFRREAIDLLARGHGGLGIRTSGQFGVVGERRRHQRRGLRARCKRDTARGKSKGEFQKVAAFHHIFLLRLLCAKKRVSMRRDERAVNCAFSFAANEADEDLFLRAVDRSGTFVVGAAFLHQARV
jgi:hypothetical protein